MRCGCVECGILMIHAEGARTACVCPECGRQCNACMGTNSVVSRENLSQLQWDARFSPENYTLEDRQHDE